MERILRAVSIAASAHAQQKRKISNEPYVNHPIRVAHQVAKAGLSSEAIQAALLHDVLEDTKVTRFELEKEFSARTIELVVLLTQWWPDDAPKEVKAEQIPLYYDAILKDTEATTIKLFDRADNLNDMARTVAKVPGWAQRYLTKSENEMGRLLKSEAHPTAINECALAMQKLKDALRNI